MTGAGTKASMSNNLWEAFKVGFHESLIQGAAPDFKTFPTLLPARGERRSGMVSEGALDSMMLHWRVKNLLSTC